MTIGILILAYLVFGMVSFLAAVSERKVVLLGSVAFGLGTLVVHGRWIILRGLKTGYWPFTNTFETLILLSFLIIAIYFVTFRLHRMVVVGGFVGLVGAVLIALTSLLSSEIEPLVPALKSNWLLFHVLSCFVGYSAFALALASATVYLIVMVFPARWFPMFGGQNKVRERSKYLDWLTYRFVAVGFSFLTLGIATGAVWANESWGRYWNWDPKETWALITWIVYVFYLHLRPDQESHGIWRALIAVFGFLIVMFTYFGVNFWLSSLHAYG